MRRNRGAALVALLTAGVLTGGPLGAQSRPQPTTLVILGVEHSAQLGGRAYHAGWFRAFFDRVHPAAICIERSPDEFARGDFYEFTYEVQDIAVPYARTRGIDLCPIDWLPSRDDERLAFGSLEVVDPPATRPATGFQSFLTLDSTAVRHTLFFADSEPSRTDARRFFDAPRAAGSRDFPRRLDLYRTFMQAMRVRGAVRAHPGATVLVVIGAMHKDDLEHILDGGPGLRLVQPSSYGAPSAKEADSALTARDLAAILSFNLLGVESRHGPVDWPWIGTVLARFEHAAPDAHELALFHQRWAVLQDHQHPAAAATAYERIAAGIDSTARFTFTGVQDQRRLDSYYDPFGNMAVRQRALVEAAREWSRAGVLARAEEDRTALLRTERWAGLRLAQLNVYWARYVTPNGGP